MQHYVSQELTLMKHTSSKSIIALNYLLGLGHVAKSAWPSVLADPSDLLLSSSW
jgi:hypothetical protein